MQMRASIARSRHGPRLLLMDEPSGHSTRSSAPPDREFSELSARENLTVLFVTHSIYEVVFCRRAYW
jgi:NitT/TauT family transport system ATP-binding protein